jgi:carboxynorspermidine decarboxylase
MANSALLEQLNHIPSPCYVVEETALERNLILLKRIQDEANCTIICALKGFATWGTFPLVSQYLPGTTASSLHEAMLGATRFGGQVHAYCPAYIPATFPKMLELCQHLTFNTLSEWDRFKDQVASSTKKVSCAIRINPEYSEVETDLYNPCVPGSRLGVRAEDLGENLPEGIEGLHFHTLCESSAESLQRTLVHVEQKFGHLLHQAKWLNMGGGHWITGQGYNVELLISLIKGIKEKYNVEVILEPGSAVGWDTGVLISTVLDVFENQGQKTAMLDTSFSAHMPDTLEMPYKPRVRNELKGGKYSYKFGGMTCLAGDFMGDFSFDKALNVGDKIIFDDMIHYTMVKTTTFNGINLPSIGILRKDGSFDLLKEYGYEDYESRLS